MGFVIVDGTITNIQDRSPDYPPLVTVAYKANGKAYALTEAVKLKHVKHKIGPVPVGQKIVPVMGNIAVGKKVRVVYDSAAPEAAWLMDNAGKSDKKHI